MKSENKIHAEENKTNPHYEPLVKFFELLLEWEMNERERRTSLIDKHEN